MADKVKKTEYSGRYVAGSGDLKWLELLERTASMLHPAANLPSIQMVYNPQKHTFKEGFIWGTGFWMQNSFGFSLGAIPLLQGSWRSALQNSYMLFWDRIGDGRRTGRDDGSQDEKWGCYNICAPDGSLGDCVNDEGIIYKQGDGEFSLYDWFYEATAAGILIQSELFLFERDIESIKKLLPTVLRSVEHIEKARDANGLFLVGPSCNLLAPSFGAAYDEKSGRIEKSYLTGLSITYGAALERLVEVAKLIGDGALEKLLSERLGKTKASLPLLMTKEGYFAKSREKNGALHGVYGAEKYGYLESSCNVDAIAHGMAGAAAESIYREISKVEGIRPRGILCANYPHLDDTYRSYQTGSRAPDSLGFASGDWVDGGCWATVEGRAMLAYMSLNKFDDAYRSAEYTMKWAEDYRQDAPFSQWGFNTNNPWANENDDYTRVDREVGIMIDNFAPVTCLLRGLFGMRAYADGLEISAHIPDGIGYYAQREPYYYAGTKLYMSCSNGRGECDIYLGGRLFTRSESGTFRLAADAAAAHARGGRLDIYIDFTRATPPSACPKACFAQEERADLGALPDELKSCASALENYGGEKDALYCDALDMLSAAAQRRKAPFDKANFRPMTDSKKAKIISIYDETAKNLCKRLIQTP